MIAKSRRLEVRQLTNSESNETASLPIALSAPINGRITNMLSFRHPSSTTDYIFFTTHTKRYAVISYYAGDNDGDGGGDDSHNTAQRGGGPAAVGASSYNIITHASGDLSDYGLAIRGNEPESGPLVTIEPHHKFIALHFYEGYVSFLPIHASYRPKAPSMSMATSSSVAAAASLEPASARQTRNKNQWEFLGPPHHCRIEERDVFCMTFLLPRERRSSKTTSSSSSAAAKRCMPQLAFLHQDSRGNQHVVAHSVDLAEKSLVLHSAISPIGSNGSKTIVPPLVEHRLKKSRVDGASGLLIPVPPIGWDDPGSSSITPNDMDADNNDLDSKPSPLETDSASCFGGVLILGERQITYHDTSKNVTKILPISQFITLSYAHVYPLASKASDQDIVRYLLGDENGKIHILAVARTKNGNVTELHLETLGVTNISSSLLYLERGLVFVGSQTADSQFIQILDKPVQVDENDESEGTLLGGKNMTYVNVLDEYTNLGPIVDFAVMPTSHHSYGVAGARAQNRQFMAVTASGAEKDGSIRFIRNGIGMTEHASVELGGIKGMWNVRKSFHDKDDAFLIQSYVGETRILGVVVNDDDEDISGEDSHDENEVSASLAEVNIEGFDSSTSTLFAGNVSLDSKSDASIMVQITEKEVRLISLVASQCLTTWTPEDGGLITVAKGNESGQIGLALRGGKLVYLQVAQVDMDEIKVKLLGSSNLGQEISCIDLNPFDSSDESNNAMDVDMDMDASMEMDDEVASKRQVRKSAIVAVGLWDSSSVQILSLEGSGYLKAVFEVDLEGNVSNIEGALGRQIMVRSVCLVTLRASTPPSNAPGSRSAATKVDMMFIGLGEGTLVSYVVKKSIVEGEDIWSAKSRKEVSIGTRALDLVPFENLSAGGGKCVLASGDRPTVIYLSRAGTSSRNNARMCYSNIHLSNEDEDVEEDPTSFCNKNAPLVVNVASPFHSSMLFDTDEVKSRGSYPLCISDDSMLRLGVIDDIQNIHVTTHKLGMPAKRVTYDENSRILCVGCIDNGLSSNNSAQRVETHMGNCIRFFDDSSLEEIDRFDLNPYEMILSMISTRMKVENDRSALESGSSKTTGEGSKTDSDLFCPFLVIGTAFGYPDEDEPSRGRVIVLRCSSDRKNESFSRRVLKVAEVQVKGGVYSVCPFFDGSILVTINSKTRLCKLVGGSNKNDALDLKIFGAGHHGHIVSLHVRSLAEGSGFHDEKKREQLAIIGDMVRSISVVKYFPEFQTLEEIARDFNQNWVTAIEMLTDNTYLGAENFNDIFALRRNPNSASEEIRCRLDTVGRFNLGEMINKFMRGSLVMSTTSGGPISEDGKFNSQKLTVDTGSQTLFGTVDGTLGSIIGLDERSMTFFSALQKAMVKKINPIGNLKHSDFRSHRAQRNQQPSRGFIDGDLIESIFNLDAVTIQSIVDLVNEENQWDVQKAAGEGNGNHKILSVDDVITMVEDMSMSH